MTNQLSIKFDELLAGTDADFCLSVTQESELAIRNICLQDEDHPTGLLTKKITFVVDFYYFVNARHSSDLS